jgi:hypothetical protein
MLNFTHGSNHVGRKATYGKMKPRALLLWQWLEPARLLGIVEMRSRTLLFGQWLEHDLRSIFGRDGSRALL